MSLTFPPPALPATQVPIRVLIIPGLHDSGPGHWQTWLQGQYRGAVRVIQQYWHQPDLASWSDSIDRTLARHDPRTQWVAVSHSFGCLALAHHLSRQRAAPRHEQHGAVTGIRAALMVAPASPDKFGIRERLPTAGLGLPGSLLSSSTDPWMGADEAHDWAAHWGLHAQCLGDVGHVNLESGHGPWPLARYKVDQMVRYLQQQRRLALAHPMEFHYAV